jgi:sulfur-carrier protein
MAAPGAPVVALRLFAAAREAAGVGHDTLSGATVAEVLAAAERRYGPAFSAVLPSCRIWLNGDTAAADDALRDGDEVAVLPPVSGGAG